MAKKYFTRKLSLGEPHTTPAQDMSQEETQTPMLVQVCDSGADTTDCETIDPPTQATSQKVTEISPLVQVSDSGSDNADCEAIDPPTDANAKAHLEWLQRISLIQDYTNSDYKLVKIDLDIDRIQRQASIVSHIDDKKSKGVSLDENEVFIHWKDNPRMGDRHQIDFSQKKHRDKLETFNIDTRCPSFPLVPDFTGFVEDSSANLSDLNISK